MRFDKSNLVILFVIFAVISFFRGETSIESVALSLPGLIIALTLHEYAHARKAVKLGDPTPEMQGRVSFSPLAHLDPIGTICLLFGGFGWGKPVVINPTNFKNPEKDGAKVAAAGPLMNLLLAIVFAIIYGVHILFGIKSNHAELINGDLYVDTTGAWFVLSQIIVNAMILNVGLAVFNLLPFPPLDGSKIYRAFLKGKAKEFLYTLENYSWIFIMILFITGIASYVIGPIVDLFSTYVLVPIINYIIQLGI